MTSTKLKTSGPDAWRFLRFVRFAALDNWSPIAASGQLTFHKSARLRPLSEVLTPVRTPIIVIDEETYHRVTVRTHGAGVLRRDTVSGRVIGTKRQFRVSSGQFIFSRIDARNGAFGLVPDALEGAIVTNDFPVFSVRSERVLADYLRLVTSTKRFRDYCQTLSKGTTNRQRVDEDTFLSIPIPLPTLTEQIWLVDAHRAALTKAEVADVLAREQEQEAARYLETALGLQPQAAKPKLAPAKLHFVRFATFERWGDIFLGSMTADTKAKYPMVRLGDVIADLQNGWSPQCLGRPATADEWGVLKLGAVTRGEFDETQTKALPASLDPIAKFEIQPGDVLITRGSGALTLVASCVFVASCRKRLMIPDLVFRVVFNAASQVTREFVGEMLRSRVVRAQIETISLGASTTMKKVTKPTLFNLRFPLPPLTEQRRIVERLEALRTEARAARADAELGRETAKQSFETALFG